MINRHQVRMALRKYNRFVCSVPNNPNVKVNARNILAPIYVIEVPPPPYVNIYAVECSGRANFNRFKSEGHGVRASYVRGR